MCHALSVLDCQILHHALLNVEMIPSNPTRDDVHETKFSLKICYSTFCVVIFFLKLYKNPSVSIFYNHVVRVALLAAKSRMNLTTGKH